MKCAVALREAPLRRKSFGGFGHPRGLFGEAAPTDFDFDPLGADFGFQDSESRAEVVAQSIDYRVLVAADVFEKNESKAVADMVFAPDDDTRGRAARARRPRPFFRVRLAAYQTRSSGSNSLRYSSSAKRSVIPAI